MNWFIFIVLSLLFIVTPYERGLYFNTDVYTVYFFIFSLFIMLVVRLLIRSETNSILPIAFVIIFPFCFFLSLFNAQNPQGAWDSLFQWTANAAFVFLIFWAAKERKIKQWMPHVFQLTGIWIAWHMIFLHFGWLFYPNAFIADRFSGVFQYPNTFGMIMIAFYLFSLVMLTNENLKGYEIALYSFPLVAFMVCFIESYSRGMYLLFPVIWIVGLLLLTPKNQLKYICYSAVTMVSALFVTRAFERDSTPFHDYPGLTYLLLFTVLTIALGFALERLNVIERCIKNIERWNEKRWGQFVAPMAIVAICLLGLLDLTNEGLVYKQLPENLQERINSINPENNTARERYYFMQDALAMSKESPLIGFGGEAWASIYKNYQQLPYQSNKIHNGFFEWIVDIGWIGFLLFVAVFLYFYYVMTKNYLKKKETALQIAVFVATLTIFSHSFIDFNMSYGTIWLMVFWLFTMVIHHEHIVVPKFWEKVSGANSHKLGRNSLYAFSILVIVCFVISYRFSMADQYYNQAQDSKYLAEREELLSKAVALNQNESKYWFFLADTYIRIKQQNINVNENRRIIKEINHKIVSLEPSNSYLLYRAGVMLERIGMKEEALEKYATALSMDQFDTEIYQHTINLTVSMALDASAAGDQSRMVHYARLAAHTYEMLQENIEAVQSVDVWHYHNSRDFHIPFVTKEKALISYFMLEKEDEIGSLVTAVTNEGESDLFVLAGMLLQELGHWKKAELIYQNNELHPNETEDLKKKYQEKYEIF
ncbi:O-antigen ligase family protein [Alkalihalobacterium chitinilyticum]|uniref:O-antigen ligase family protein n=1 Tax=Alkalihalobacterium chitinilyticum TaxID=2980103 RepID=A0ABT5VEX5_9BACI|nr:O-antigen ligase family protein [Alkalihalobacterium chitinilyticum]MDE5414011.1 O-antigen ligase family protein [Alkalihalobacterium chitinilyticum]